MKIPTLYKFATSATAGLAVLMMLFCIGVSSGQDTATHKKVLFIFNNDSFTATQIAIDHAARAALKDDPNIPIETYSEYVGDTRVGPDYEKEFVALVKKKYEGKHFDLIFAVTNSPIRIIIRNRDELFADTPIILLSLDRLDLDPAALGPNATAVAAPIDFSGTLDIALAQNPQATRVVLIGGLADIDKYWTARAQQELSGYDSRLQFSNLTGLTVSEMRHALGTLPADTVVLFVTSVRDHNGNVYESPEYLRQITSASTVPIYGTTDAQLGNGIVGGSVASFETLGTEGAKSGLRLLSGETIQNVPPRTIPGQPMFDWRQMQRWHISEADLPAGSIIQFKQLSAWQQYRWYAIASMLAIIVQAVLIVWLMVLRTRRRQAKSENLRLSSDLKEIVANVPGIVWETRTDPATKQRRTTFISSYVQKMLGYSPEEWLEKPPGFGMRLVSDEDRERAARDSEEVMLSGKDGVSEFRWLAKDGSIRWIENYLSPIFNGGSQVIGMRGVALDVTNRKLVEEKARQTEEKDRALLAAIPDLMFLQTVDGVYLDYHAKEPSDLFVPPEEFLGKNIREVLPSDLAEQFVGCFEAAEDGGDPVICEYSLDLGGRNKWFEARMVRSGNKILSIVREITDLKRTEREAQELSRRLITAQEDERARLARELHDGASQNLALLSIELGTIGQMQPVDQTSLDTKMNEISERISRLSDDLHRMSHELHPAVLRHLGLVSAVREFCHEIDSANDVKVEFADRDVPRTLPDQISLNLYRIVQESLRNVVKHSGAANVSVLLEAEGKRLRLAISDDGHGFDANAKVVTNSLGLTSMRERARMLNGTISIDSTPAEGTKIEVTIPSPGFETKAP